MTTPIFYDPNTPTKQLPFAQWQTQFIQNFTQLGAAFAVNHVPLDDSTSANRGNHTIVEMPVIENEPQTDAVSYAIYSDNVETQTAQVFCTFPGNTPKVQFTNYQLYSIDSTNFFTFLPGKILVYFGSFTPTAANQILKLRPPVAKNIISMNFCTKTNANLLTNITPSGFVQTQSNGFFTAIQLQYLAAINPIYYVVVANV